MKCSKCKTEMTITTGKYEYRECGLEHVYLINWDIYLCPKGHSKLALAPDIERLKTEIVTQLVRMPARLSGDQVVYCRKALGVRAAILGTILKKDRVTVSRWENGKYPIDAHSDFKLRMASVDHMAISSHEKNSLKLELATMFQHEYNPDERASSDILIPATANAVAGL